MTTQLKIEGMSCGHCVAAVKKALESVPGVENAAVDLERGTARVTHSDGLNSAALVEAVEEEGYRAETGQEG